MNCTVIGCFNKYYAKGFCQKHYDNNKRRGDPLKDPVYAKDQPCTVTECVKKIFVNGMCAMHNKRNVRHGDPLYVNPKCNRDGQYRKRALAKSASWKSEHRDINNGFNGARKQKIKKASLSDAYKAETTDVYLGVPEGHAVDHILPINHDAVCGLHVPWNLQYLTKTDNAKKSNKFDGTYENESWRKK